MKRSLLLSSLLMISTASFAESLDFAYFNVDQIMESSIPAKTLANTINAKFSPQEAQLQQLVNKLNSDESQLYLIQKNSSSYAKLSKNDKEKYDALNQVYMEDIDNFSDSYVTYKKQLRIVNRYATKQLMQLVNKGAGDYAQHNKIRLIYNTDQLVYAPAENDITNKLLPLINQVDVSKVVDSINKASLSN